jgi:hypothetical protein
MLLIMTSQTILSQFQPVKLEICSKLKATVKDHNILEDGKK